MFAQTPWRVRVYALGHTNEIIQFVEDSLDPAGWSAENEGFTAVSNTSLSSIWAQNDNLRVYYQPDATNIQEKIWGGRASGWLQGAEIGSDVEGVARPA